MKTLRTLYMFIFALCAFTLVPAVAHAQALTPAVTILGPRATEWHANAAEAMVNIEEENLRTRFRAAPPSRAQYPKDSIRAVSEDRARAWVSTLQASQVQGLQLDPAGLVAVTAHDEVLAQRQIKARLTTPGLSLYDRAYTLSVAVQGFASADFPERLPIAERYLAQLDALGTPAAYWQRQARCALVHAYFKLGMTEDVVRTGTRAMALSREIPYDWRAAVGIMYEEGGAYIELAVALSGQPDGRTKIREINKTLLANVIVPPELLSRDSAVWNNTQRGAKYITQKNVDISERLGRMGTPLVANYWVNRGPTRDSQAVAVNDGKIRVIEFGGLGCDGCVDGMLAMERMCKLHPDVEFVTLSVGWTARGNRVVGAKTIADDMADHIINKLRITYPYGIVMPTKIETTDDDGEALVPEFQWWDASAYPMLVKPTFYVVDSKGIIRFVCAETSTREVEEQIRTVLEFLKGVRSASKSIGART